jgi:hypothetical protein
LASRGSAAGQHNLTALRRVAVEGEPQTLQLLDAMGGPAELALGALLDLALRVTLHPLDDAEPRGLAHSPYAEE